MERVREGRGEKGKTTDPSRWRKEERWDGWGCGQGVKSLIWGRWWPPDGPGKRYGGQWALSLELGQRLAAGALDIWEMELDEVPGQSMEARQGGAPLSPEMLMCPVRRGLRADPQSGKQEVIGDLEQSHFSEVPGRRGSSSRRSSKWEGRRKQQVELTFVRSFAINGEQRSRMAAEREVGSRDRVQQHAFMLLERSSKERSHAAGEEGGGRP